VCDHPGGRLAKPSQCAGQHCSVRRAGSVALRFLFKLLGPRLFVPSRPRPDVSARREERCDGGRSRPAVRRSAGRLDCTHRRFRADVCSSIVGARNGPRHHTAEQNTLARSPTCGRLDTRATARLSPVRACRFARTRMCRRAERREAPWHTAIREGPHARCHQAARARPP
jgi:hypothetical protein